MTATAQQRAANEGLIARVLRGLGLNSTGAAGALGNFDVESHFDPAAYNAGEGAIGIAQWEQGRRDALQAFARQTGGAEDTLATQLGYLGTELRADPSLIAALNAAPNPAAAAAIFDARFERSAGTSRGERMAAANAAAALAANPGTAIALPTTPAGGTASVGWHVPGLGDLAGGAIGAVNPFAPWLVKGLGTDAVGGALSSTAGQVGQVLANAALKLTFVAAGAALVVAGIYHTTKGPREQLASAATAAADVAL